MSIDRATSRGYAVFSRVLLQPLDAETVSLFGDNEAVLDDLAAQQHAIFSLLVPPYAGFFLDEQGLVGGAEASALATLYRESGFLAPMPNASADHLGVIFGALSFLTARGDESAILRLMDEHLLRWFPAFVAAAWRHTDGFWRDVVSLMRELVFDHRRRLGPARTAFSPLPEPPPLLDNERTGLRDIARYLCTPVAAGSCITRRDIDEIARALDLPRGFGSRSNMLESLLRGAAEYDRFPEAARTISALLAQHAGELTELCELGELCELCELGELADPWRQRIAFTREVLAETQRQHMNAHERRAG